MFWNDLFGRILAIFPSAVVKLVRLFTHPAVLLSGSDWRASIHLSLITSCTHHKNVSCHHSWQPVHYLLTKRYRTTGMPHRCKKRWWQHIARCQSSDTHNRCDIFNFFFMRRFFVSLCRKRFFNLKNAVLHVNCTWLFKTATRRLFWQLFAKRFAYAIGPLSCPVCL